MKQIFQKNQFIITTLAIMIAVAGYLNFSKTDLPTLIPSQTVETQSQNLESLDISEGDSIISEKIDDDIIVPEESGIGEAVQTQAEVTEYLAEMRLEREQTYAKAKETFEEMMENEQLSESEKQTVTENLHTLTDHMEKEKEVEQLLYAKGYQEVFVRIGTNDIDVVLNCESLSDSDRAQIEDIVTRKTGYDVSQLVISRMNDGK